MEKQKKVLIVEDEAPLVKAMVNKFSSQSFKTLTANDGVEGLRLALTEKPDLILLDVILPKMDGLTLLAEIQKTDWGKTVDVIILTNLSDNKKLDAARASGSYDYLIKTDWKINDVLAEVLKKLDK